MFVLFAKLSCTVPSDEPSPVTGIDHVDPPSLVVGVPTVPPVEPLNGNEKFAAVTPVTGALNVARNVTLLAFVICPDGTDR